MGIDEEIKKCKQGVIRDKALVRRINRSILKVTGLKSFEYEYPCKNGSFVCKHTDIKFIMDMKYLYVSGYNFETEQYLKFAYGLKLSFLPGCFYPFLTKI